jgi:hypothetical protein
LRPTDPCSVRFPAESGGSLEDVARAAYRRFVGELWGWFGENVWLGAWIQLASRAGEDAGILEILRSISDPSTRSAADVLVNGGADPDLSRKALTNAFDKPAISDERTGHCCEEWRDEGICYCHISDGLTAVDKQ